MSYRRTTTLTVLRVVEEFDDTDEAPSLPGMRVYDTDGEEITGTRGSALAKCGAVASERRRAGSRK
jgi:hypothetical protein